MTFKHDQKNDNTLEALQEPTLRQLSSIKHAFLRDAAGWVKGGILLLTVLMAVMMNPEEWRKIDEELPHFWDIL